MVLNSYMVPSTNIGTLSCPQALHVIPQLVQSPQAFNHAHLHPLSSLIKDSTSSHRAHTHTLCSLVPGPCRSLCFSLMQLGKYILDLLLIFDWDHSSAHSRMIPEWSTSGVPTLEFWCACLIVTWQKIRTLIWTQPVPVVPTLMITSRHWLISYEER